MIKTWLTWPLITERLQNEERLNNIYRCALHELELARMLDSRDPSARFYEAILLQEQNRLNDAVRGAEAAKDLNDNRRL